VIIIRKSKDRQHNGQKKSTKGQEEFEDTKGVSIIRISMNRQHNGQKKSTKWQTTIYKTLHIKLKID